MSKLELESFIVQFQFQKLDAHFSHILMFEVAKNAKYAVNKKIIANKTIWWIVEMGDGGSWEGH